MFSVYYIKKGFPKAGEIISYSEQPGFPDVDSIPENCGALTFATNIDLLDASHRVKFLVDLESLDLVAKQPLPKAIKPV